MRLSRLELSNFRCFPSLVLDLDPTTVIVGANDTGKSTVLEATRLLLDSPDGQVDWSAVAPLPAYPSGTFGGWVPRWKQDPESEVRIVGTFDDLSKSELAMLGPLAPNGTVRLARSSKMDGLWVLFDVERREDLEDWLAGPDGHGIDEVDEGKLLDVLEDDGTVRVHDRIGWFSDRTLDRLGDEYGYEGPVGRISLDRFAVVSLGGPGVSTWAPSSVVEPILRRRLSGLYAEFYEPLLAAFKNERNPAWHASKDLLVVGLLDLNGAVEQFLNRLSSVHTAGLPRGIPFDSVRWGARVSKEQFIDALVRELMADVHRRGSAGGTGNVALERLGPGSQRAVALAALGLYRDQDLWPTAEGSDGPSLAILLVKEPEVGLHPAAQQEVVRALREWSTYGLQLILVTHSPAFVNAAPLEGVRVARRDPASGAISIQRPQELEEVRRSLGVKPADILLARRFVIVEGESDRAILSTWSRRIGADLAAAGVQLVESGGYAGVERVRRFLTLAYQGADFLVVLDNGVDSARVGLELDATFGERARAVILSRTEIEGYFVPRAIEAWLRLSGEDPSAADLGRSVVETVEGQGSRVKALRILAQRHLGRPYDKLRDGLAIAGLT